MSINRVNLQWQAYSWTLTASQRRICEPSQRPYHWPSSHFLYWSFFQPFLGSLSRVGAGWPTSARWSIFGTQPLRVRAATWVRLDEFAVPSHRFPQLLWTSPRIADLARLSYLRGPRVLCLWFCLPQRLLQHAPYLFRAIRFRAGLP